MQSEWSSNRVKRHPYPSYRDSGVEWLGEIPAHWEVVRLKKIANVMFSSVDKHSFEDEESVFLCNYVDVYKNDIITSELGFMKATASKEEIKKFTLKRDDVLITKDSESWNDIAIAAYVPENLCNVVCGYHLALVRPKTKQIDGRFLFYSFHSRPINYQFEVEATGITRYGIDQYAIGSGLFVLPPLPEQRAIADFLDRETARIDALIARYQRLMELLEEKRASLISQAVTRGLDASVAMKDSGVEWLGEVPTHWNLVKLKHIAQLKSGESINSDDMHSEGYFPVYGGNGLRGYTNAYTHDGRFILIGRQGALCGNINYAEGKFWASEHAVVVTPVRPLITIWLGELLRAINLNQFSISAAQPGISVERINQLIIPFPPISEQKDIARLLDSETARIALIKEEIVSMIDKLKEYRTALISAAVTGKMDVRAGGSHAV